MCNKKEMSKLDATPPFANRFLNTNWAVGLTYWIVYIHFFVFWHMQLYMSWYIISFLALSLLLNILYFSSTLVLTSSIDVVFVLSIKIPLTWIFDLDRWPWIFKVKLYVGNGRPDCHGTNKGTGVDMMPWCETLKKWVNKTLCWLGCFRPLPLTLNFQGQIVSPEWEARLSWN